MDLSEIERDILEKASDPQGTSYIKHDWISELDFIEIAEKLVEKGLLEKIYIQVHGNINISIFKKLKNL